METQEYRRTYNIPFTLKDILNLIRSLSIEDKVRVEKELEKETLLFRARRLDKRIKKNTLGIDDIISEVAEYRAERNEE